MTQPGKRQTELPLLVPVRERFSAAARPTPSKLPKSRPFSVRLTKMEREALEAAAGTKPIGAFVRERLLEAPARRKSGRHPSTDKAVLGQILATLGRSKVSASLADLSAAARLGTIVITPDMEAQILAVCVDIQDVKRMLLRGLGLETEPRR